MRDGREGAEGIDPGEGKDMVHSPGGRKVLAGTILEFTAWYPENQKGL
jgi:hypothetical protein